MAAEKQWIDPKFVKQVTELLDEEGTTVTDVAKQLDVSKGTVALARLRGRIPVKQRENLYDAEDDAVGARVVKLRGDNLSWGEISARIGVPESRVRSTYEEASGESTKGLKLEGKGGRRPAEEGGSSKAAKSSTKKAPAKKAAAGKRAAKGSGPGGKKVLVEMSLEELTERITGKTITIGRGQKTSRVFVKSVVSLEDGAVEFFDKNQKSRTVAVANIVRVSP